MEKPKTSSNLGNSTTDIHRGKVLGIAGTSMLN